MDSQIQNSNNLENRKIFRQNLYAFLIYFIFGLLFLLTDNNFSKFIGPWIVLFFFAVHSGILVIFSIVSAIKKNGLGDKYFGSAFLLALIGVMMLFFFYAHMAKGFVGIY